MFTAQSASSNVLHAIAIAALSATSVAVRRVIGLQGPLSQEIRGSLDLVEENLASRNELSSWLIFVQRE
jgi:hypothetical protein